MKIILGGSRQLSNLHDEVIDSLNSWCREGGEFLIGDAKGTDAKFQQYLRSKQYSNVQVYYSGDEVRHNLGNWETIRIDSGLKSKGHALHTAKDREMTKIADTGLMIWDTLSAGTLANVIDLLQQDKSCQMFIFGEYKDLYYLKSLADLERWRNLYPEVFEESEKRLVSHAKRQDKKKVHDQDLLF